MMDNSLLEILDLKKNFTTGAGFFGGGGHVVRAIDGVTLRLVNGETLGLVGESGCGKSTLARLIVGLEKPSGGRILFEKEDVSALKGEKLKEYRRNVQMIFQDPYASLNPRMKAGDIIAEPLKIHKQSQKTNTPPGRGEINRKLIEIARLTGIDEEQLQRYPHEFSGGQRQRIGIARALILRPRLVIADEPVSALDLSVQAQILNLLKSLQDEFALTYLFISHDFGVIRHMSARIAVMYMGRIVELAETARLCDSPLHPYTQALIAAVPELDPSRKGRRKAQADNFQSLDIPPSGCAFSPRCPYKTAICEKESPRLAEYSAAHLAACHNMDKKKLAFEKKR